MSEKPPRIPQIPFEVITELKNVSSYIKSTRLNEGSLNNTQINQILSKINTDCLPFFQKAESYLPTPKSQEVINYCYEMVLNSLKKSGLKNSHRVMKMVFEDKRSPIAKEFGVYKQTSETQRNPVEKGFSAYRELTTAGMAGNMPYFGSMFRDAEAANRTVFLTAKTGAQLAIKSYKMTKAAGTAAIRIGAKIGNLINGGSTTP